MDYQVHNPELVTIAVEPEGSIVFGKPGKPYYQSGTAPHKAIQWGCWITVVLIMANKSLMYVLLKRLVTLLVVLVYWSVALQSGISAGLINNSTICGNVALAMADGGEKYLQTIFNDTYGLKSEI